MFDKFKAFVESNGGISNWKTNGPLLSKFFWDANKDELNKALTEFMHDSTAYAMRMLPVGRTETPDEVVISYNNEIFTTPANLKKLSKTLADEYGLDATRTFTFITEMAKPEAVQNLQGRSANAQLIHDCLTAWNVSFDESGLLKGDIYGSGIRDIKLDMLIDRIMVEADAIASQTGMGFEKEYLKSILSNTLNQKKDEKVTTYRQILKYTGDNVQLVDKMVGALLELGKIPKTPVNKEMMKHLLWSIKRKIYDLPIPYPVFTVFYSKAMGVGKSYFIENILGGPFKDKVNTVGEIKQLLSDNDAKALVNGYWLIDFQELTIPESARNKDGSVSESTLNKLKSSITSQYLNGRQMYTDTSAKLRQSAVFCSSANKHCYDVIHDENGMRRYWEFNWGVQNQADVDLELSEKIQKWMIALYQNIDENFDNGYYHPSNELFPEMVKVQAQYRYIPMIEQFTNEYGIVFHDSPVEGCEILPKMAFYEENFKPWIEGEGKLWQLSGMVKAIQDRFDIKPVAYQLGKIQPCYFFTQDISKKPEPPTSISNIKTVTPRTTAEMVAAIKLEAPKKLEMVADVPVDEKWLYEE